MYREEGRTKCPACQREVAQVREIPKGQPPADEAKVSRHLFQTGTETTEIGYPILNEDGFCPGSFARVKVQ